MPLPFAMLLKLMMVTMPLSDQGHDSYEEAYFLQFNFASTFVGVSPPFSPL